MTLANQSNLIPKLLETVGTLDTGGTDSILGAFRLVRNQAMWLKRSHVLGALHSEHFEGRHSHASGFKDGGKDKILKARLGEVTVRISQTRGGAFYLQSLERSRRSEKARAGHRRDVGDGGVPPARNE